MKIFTGLMCLMLLFSWEVLAEPYAEVIKLPSKDKKSYGAWKWSLSEIQVPDKASVGTPAYSGARITGIIKIGGRGMGRPRNTPKITLLTMDERATVSAFYKQKLKGWKHREEKRVEYFWTGEDYFAPFRSTDQDTTSVTLRDVEGPTDMLLIGDVMPDAKTEITIVYDPVK